jgi:hypothetical protein
MQPSKQAVQQQGMTPQVLTSRNRHHPMTETVKHAGDGSMVLMHLAFGCCSLLQLVALTDSAGHMEAML